MMNVKWCMEVCGAGWVSSMNVKWCMEVCGAGCA